MLQNRLTFPRSWIALACVALIGCDEDKRLLEQSQQSQQRQAAQNHDMARLNQQVAEGAKRLVEADAKARQEFIQVQQTLDRQREQLISDQRQLAEQRHRDPIIAAALSGLAILLACLVPLALGIYVLRTVSRTDSNDSLAELLVMELTSDQPLLGEMPRLPAPRLANPPPTALPSPPVAD